MNKKIKLYIVKKGDTLEEIAKKCNCKIDEITSLNHLLKKKIFENQPLLVPFYEESHERTDKQLTSDKIIILLFLIKETYLNCLYCYDKYNLSMNKTINYMNTINDKQNINDYFKKLLIFPNLLLLKNEKQLIDYEKDLTDSLEKIKNNESEDFFTYSNIKYISEQYQLYILKTGNKNYKEAELIFDNILNMVIFN